MGCFNCCSDNIIITATCCKCGAYVKKSKDGTEMWPKSIYCTSDKSGLQRRQRNNKRHISSRRQEDPNDQRNISVKQSPSETPIDIEALFKKLLSDEG